MFFFLLRLIEIIEIVFEKTKQNVVAIQISISESSKLEEEMVISERCRESTDSD